MPDAKKLNHLNWMIHQSVFHHFTLFSFKIVVGSLLLLLAGCRPSIHCLRFETDMGVLNVRLNDKAAAIVPSLLCSDTLACVIPAVLQDGYIQWQGVAPTFNAPPDMLPFSGDFIVTGGRFYLIQGRRYTDTALDKYERQTGKKLSAAQRTHLKNIGGALHFNTPCVVLGSLQEGRAVLDRITALPADANGRPLRQVQYRVIALELAN